MGLVFFGEAPEVNERAAKWFEKWVAKHKSKSSYDAQTSISYEGMFVFSRWANGAKSWHKFSFDKEIPKVGEGAVLSNGFHNKCEEVRIGFATSYVYFPCAE